MDYEDWLYCMGQLKVMNCRMPTARGGFPAGVVEVDEDDTDELKNEDGDSQAFLSFLLFSHCFLALRTGFHGCSPWFLAMSM